MKWNWLNPTKLASSDIPIPLEMCASTNSLMRLNCSAVKPPRTGFDCEYFGSAECRSSHKTNSPSVSAYAWSSIPDPSMTLWSFWSVDLRLLFSKYRDGGIFEISRAERPDVGGAR